MDQDLEKAFLSELEALEKFRVSYTGMYPSAALASDDPDVRRLLEALAFFTARTRLAADRNVGESLLRIFRQHFPYLLSPVPSMVMLQANVSRRYVDVSTLPRGSEITLVKKSDGNAPDEAYSFRTLAPLRVLPIEIVGLETFRNASRGPRLALRFSTSFPRNDRINEIELHIDYLNDLQSSLLVMHELKGHWSGVSVAWSHSVDGGTRGEPCQVEFGAVPPKSDEVSVFDHPLQAVRALLQFPQQDLFFRIRGLSPPRNWQDFTIFIDLKESWPANLRLNADCFRLHVVPLINMRREMADPIEHDATVERHLARHPDRSLGFVPLTVLAAYRKTEKGLLPLEPAMVGADRPSFEALVDGKGEDRKAWLTLNLPGAFDAPESVAVEALWHQPAVSERSATELTVRLATRFVDGIEWDLFGPLMPHADAEIDEDREAMLQLLSLKGQRLLGYEEIRFLLRAFGLHRQRLFARLIQRIESVRIIDKPLAKKANGFKHIYEIVFEELTPSDVPRLAAFASRLLDILRTWSVDEVIELIVRIPNLEKEIRCV